MDIDPQTQWLQGFKFQSILNWDNKVKTLIMLGNFDKDPSLKAILIFRKIEFPSNYLNQLESLSRGTNYFKNDIYHKFTLQFDLSQYNHIDCELIYPAEQNHVEKYSKTQYNIVRESPQDYSQYVLPYITKQIQTQSLQWVYNILEKKAETEKILFEVYGESGFVLIRDYSFKPDSKINNLHILAIITNRKLNSLRDLTHEHIDMLQTIYTKGIISVSQIFDVPVNHIKVFIHYHPSFYHFHVHFKHVDIQGETFRDHILQNVIQNLKMSNNYYQTVDLEYIITEKQFKNIFTK